MIPITDLQLITAFELGSVEVAPRLVIGQTPSLSVNVDGQEFARINCSEGELPVADVIPGSSTVKVCSSGPSPECFEVNCLTADQAVWIANTINSQLQSGYETLFGKSM